jgi:UDP-N-acetylglucosamine 2-epimerase (non-hydrolysing)
VNSRKLIAVVAGTRPEAVKMAPVYFALKRSNSFETVLLATAQHRQMLDQTLATFGITPEHDLNLMQPGQSLVDLTGRVLSAVSDWCSKYKPSAVLVQGDTTTVLSASLSAFYNRVPIGHVEAGLRTGNMASPFPEEMNRRLTSPLARWHFCPTDLGARNLAREHIKTGVFVTGNTVVDALLWMRNKLAEKNAPTSEMVRRLGIPKTFAERYLDHGDAPWILVTGHRRESFGDGFERICLAIKALTEKYPDLGMLYPVHLNPNVREPVNRILAGNERVALIEPANYEDFIWLMDRCRFILSDSGGVQEEAPSLGKPVLVMRETTERPEGVEAGTCRLVGTSVESILYESNRLLQDKAEYDRRSKLANPYGDGTAAEKICRILESELEKASNVAP